MMGVPHELTADEIAFLLCNDGKPFLSRILKWQKMGFMPQLAVAG